MITFCSLPFLLQHFQPAIWWSFAIQLTLLAVSSSLAAKLWLKKRIISALPSHTAALQKLTCVRWRSLVDERLIKRICLTKLIKMDKKCKQSAELRTSDGEDSAFSFLHRPLASAKPKCDQRVFCYPVVKYPHSYSGSVISIRKQQQLDSFGARDFIDAITNSLTPEERESLMCQERQRLRTFELGWPHESYLPSREMARAGFYFLNNADKVQCVFCRGVLHNWLPGDRPMEEHSKHFRNCKLVRGQPCGNIPYNTDNEAVGQDMMTNILLAGEASSGATAESLGINTQKAAKPEYAAEASRIRTYGRFPATCPVPAKKICEAGFYYTGFDDAVKCFWCEGGLQNWEGGEDPWVEHARYFPSCHFIIAMRGEDLISEASSGVRPCGIEQEAHAQKSRPPSTHYYSGMIKTCVSMGYQESDVVKVIKMRNNNPISSTKELLQALHQMEDGSGDIAVCAGSESQSTASTSADVHSREAGCKLCGRSSDIKQITHIGLPCGCLILCDDCAKKGVPVRCPKCLTSLAGLMRVYLG